MKIHHLNCGILQAPGGPPAACHCLLVECGQRVVLIDTGVGARERVPAQAVEAAGFQFHENLRAVHQVPQLSDIVLTHGDPDHAGGLADFPQVPVHLAQEELAALQAGDPRYAADQFCHQPHWRPHGGSRQRWFGLEARRLFPDAPLYLIALFGHTPGHCGVAVELGERWLLHVGDAYYLRAELDEEHHPVDLLASRNAVDDALRRHSLAQLRRLAACHPEVEMVGTHDFSEFPC